MSDSNLLCCECQHPFSNAQMNKLLEFNTQLCRNCGFGSYIEFVNLRMAEDCEYLRDRKAVFNQYWYHISVKDDLDTNMIMDHPIHIGTPKTVRHYREMVFSKKPKFVYKFRILHGALVRNKIEIDVNDWYGSEDEIKEGDYDILRYINRYESPGQVSLLCSPEALECVGKTNNRII